MRDESAFAGAKEAGHRVSASYRGATHIVQLWDPNAFPQLAANECFCLKAARACGLEVPASRLAEDGMALLIDRFDRRPDGSYRGVKDFCVLNARRTAEKYRGSYENHVFRRFAQFANATHVTDDLETLFALIALNAALRNEDAHLKNFAIVYDEVEREARLAPEYDLVTTSVYLPTDGLALTLNGTTKWPTAKELQRLGETRGGFAPARARQALERIAGAMQRTAKEVQKYRKEHPEFEGIGKRMLQEWENGVTTSLRAGNRRGVAIVRTGGLHGVVW